MTVCSFVPRSCPRAQADPALQVWDFVTGIGVGIILACISFVVSSSQRRAVRSILTGAVARSTVRRHPKQSAFLREVGRQIRVIKLQGFLFFGTISSCEGTIRRILDAASWSANPIRFLVLDFSMASGRLQFTSFCVLSQPLTFPFRCRLQVRLCFPFVTHETGG